MSQKFVLTRAVSGPPGIGTAAVISVVVIVVVFAVIFGIAWAAFQAKIKQLGHRVIGYQYEVFAVKLTHIPGYNPGFAVTQQQIFTDAKANGWSIATFDQLSQAQKNGAQWCNQSYFGVSSLGNLEFFGYPMVDAVSGCHAPGVSRDRLPVITDPSDSTAKIPLLESFAKYPWCYLAYGIKPPAECVLPAESILPFNSTKWSQHSKSTSTFSPPANAVGETFFVAWEAITPFVWIDARPSIAQIVAHASRNNWTIATFDQIETDRLSGLAVCANGVYDYDGQQFLSYGYPMTTPGNANCHGEFTSRNTFDTFVILPNGAKVGNFNLPLIRGYYAYGIKPLPNLVSPANTVAPFQRDQWSRWSKLTYQWTPPWTAKTARQEVFLVQWEYFYGTPLPSQLDIWRVEQTVASRVWTVATPMNLLAAYKDGAEWCINGMLNWTDRFNSTGYPMQRDIPGGCTKGVNILPVTMDPKLPIPLDRYTNAHGVVIFGVKPPSGTPFVVPFNSQKWSQFE